MSTRTRFALRHIRNVLLTLCLLAASVAGLGPWTSPGARGQGDGGSGGVDPVFGGVSLGLVGSVAVTTVQPDGKVLVGGSFKSGLARLNADGSVDNSFRPVGVVGVYALAVQADGKIVLAGSVFDQVNLVYRLGVARLNADGSLDAGFNANVNSGTVYSLALQPDGKIVVGGQFTRINGTARNDFARLNADGSLDAGFNASVAASFLGVRSVALQPDGKVLLGGTFAQVNGVARDGIARLNADGSLDAGFSASTSGGSVYALAVQPDGKLVLGGNFTGVNGVTHNGVARLNGDGGLDLGFSARASGGGVYALAVQRDGGVVLGGTFTSVNGVTHSRIARLNADGSLDAGFTASADSRLFTLAVQSDGKVLLGGFFTLANGVARSSLARLNADGSLDGNFVPDVASGPNGPVYAVVVQADGKLLLGGRFTVVNGVARTGIVRLNTDGSLDGSFAASTSLDASFDGVRALAVQTDGRIVLGGSFTRVDGVARSGIARLNPDGSLDQGFAADADIYLFGVRTLAIQPDGKIVLGGDFDEINGVKRDNVARLNGDGSLDPGFNPNVFNASLVFPFVYTLAVQADGRIVLGGQFTQVNGVARDGLARLNADGSLDTGFNAALSLGFADPSVNAVAVQPDGKLLLGGNFNQVNGVTQRYDLARLNADGSLDQEFNASVSNGTVSSISVQPDGKVVIGGDFTQANETTRSGFTRLNADGSVDASFDSGGSGTDRPVNALALQPDGKFLLGGDFASVDGQLRNHVARMAGDANRPTPLVSVVNAGPSRGGFLVSRTGGQLGQPLIVTYHVGGAAVGGDDYQTLSGRVTFKASQSEKVIPVRLLPGANRNHKVKVFLDPTPGGEYDTGTAQGKVFLSDLPQS